jgi:hypothetical protein
MDNMERRPRIIRIVQPGWDGFTGHFGSTEFKNGVSIYPVDPVFIDRIAAEIKVVEHETDESLGVQVRMIDAQCVRLSVLDQLPRATPEDLIQRKPEPEKDTKEETKEPPKVWTDEDLMAIADTEGIKGLRAIGDPMGAKGRAIPELIMEILKVQKEEHARADALLPRGE